MKILSLFIFLMIPISVFSQDKKSPVLFIDDNVELACQNYPYSKDQIDSSINKVNYENDIIFFICKHKFSAKKSLIEIIDYNKFKELSFWSFGQMQYERLRMGFINFDNCFDKIYFVEKTGVNQYKKYLVTWEPVRNMDRVDLDSKF